MQLVQGRADRWRQWREIARCNPLVRVAPEMAAKLREERQEAIDDERLRARFLSFRLNLPSSDESSMLLSVLDWQRTLARPVPERDASLPIIGVDLGSGRAFSAATAVWPNGRVESHRGHVPASPISTRSKSVTAYPVAPIERWLNEVFFESVRRPARAAGRAICGIQHPGPVGRGVHRRLR